VRKKLLTTENRRRLFVHIREYSTTKDIHLLEINGFTDHVHCLISVSPDQNIAAIIQLLKGESSFWANKHLQFPEKFIPLSITNLIDGNGIPVYGDGLNSRDWLHVLDHCDALNCIIEKGIPGEIYNIGGGAELSNLDLAKLLVSSFGKNDSYINFVPDRKGHDFRYSVNYEKIAINCGYKPSRIFQESINETIAWYKKNESWWRPLKETKN
jgi:hypothetical protein